MQSNKKPKTKEMQKQCEPPFIVELTLGDDRDFYEVLLEAIDNSFSSLGEPVKTSIYDYLENSVGIRKDAILFRIDDFQKALEKLFGIGARYLEILIIKNLREKIKIEFKEDMPSREVPDLTFQEYIRQVKMAYENSNEKS